jgi:UDP-GlcNAc3NAcA epimerase
LFVPTETAKDNLLTEGIMKDKIFHLGDIMYDAALFYRGRSEKPRWYDSLGIRDNGYVLCTIHRAENTENLDKLQEIFNGLEASGRPVILPLHPRTKGRIAEIGLTVGSNIFIVEPVGYLEMVWLEMHCQLIATDSGGVQKEAFFHRKPCVTLREETEWVELVDVCANILVGSRSAEIASAISTARWVEPSTNPFGNGDAAEKIVKSILKISC